MKSQAEVNKYLREAVDLGRKLSAESARIRAAWDLIPGRVKSAFRGFEKFFEDAVGRGSALKEIANHVSSAIESGYQNTRMMSIELESEIALYQKLLDQRQKISKAMVAELDPRKKKALTDELKTLYEKSKIARDNIELGRHEIQQAQKHNAILDQVKNAEKAIADLTSPAVFALSAAVFASINSALKETNGHFSERRGLANEILQVQAKTGNELTGTLAATKALVGYGYDLRSKAFKPTLETVVKLEESLGISEEQSAEMALIWERRMGIPLRGVADIIAEVVQSTALSATESAKFATNIGRAFAIMRGGFSQENVKTVTRYILELEGASKATTGISGEFQEMFKQMTTSVEGIRTANLLGLGDMKSLTPEKMTQGLEHISQIINGMTGPARLAAAKQYSSMLGVSAETLLTLPEILKEMKRTQEERKPFLEFEENWRQQVTFAGAALKRLSNSLMSLVHSGLTPLIYVFGVVSGWITRFIQWLAASPKAFYALGTAITIAGTVLAAKAARSFVLLGIALRDVARKAQEAAIATKTQALATSSDGKTGFLKRIKDTLFGKKGKAKDALLGNKGKVITVSALVLWIRQFITTLGSKIYGVLKTLGGFVTTLGGTIAAISLLVVSIGFFINKYLSEVRKIRTEGVREQQDFLNKHIEKLIEKHVQNEKNLSKLEHEIYKFNALKAENEKRSLVQQAQDFEQSAAQLEIARQAQFVKDQISVAVNNSPQDTSYYNENIALQKKLLAEAEKKRLQDEAQAKRAEEERIQRARQEATRWRHMPIAPGAPYFVPSR